MAEGVALKDRKVLYNMKFDQTLLSPFENDADIVILMRGNDSHAYLYIAGMEGPCACVAVVREQQVHHDCHCEANMATGVDLGGAGSGRQLLKENVNGVAVSRKLLR